MSNGERAATGSEIARSRNTSHSLGVMARKLSFRITALLVWLSFMASGVVLSGLMLGGYVRPPAMQPIEIQQVANIILGLCLAGCGLAAYFLIVFWEARIECRMSHRRLDTAIEQAVKGN